MSNFRTVVSPGASHHQMALSDKILTIGSCFADAIGQKFTQNKISTCANPYGTLYNPDAITKALRYSVFNESPPPQTFLRRDEVFLNYDFHAEISALSAQALQAQLTEIIGATHHFIARAQWLMITFGTAWIYTRTETGEIVANCHKQPASQFTKSLLTSEEIVASFRRFHEEARKVNPGLKIILTVSPVRHIKDTLEMNSVSKSILRTACHSLTESIEDVDYFPAFEIMIDDLRDYRFYSADMIHPSDVAVEYIWEKFRQRYFSPSLAAFVAEWTDIQRALAHKPYHPETTAHQSFLIATQKRLEQLGKTVDVSAEINFVKEQRINHSRTPSP